MTPVTATGSTSISSCFKCEKVFSLAGQLKKNMQEFEVFTMEMQFDPKSAESKSREVLSNFWQLISTIQSLTIGKKTQAKKDCCENQTSTRIVVSVEEGEAKSWSKSLEKENEPAKSESNSESKPVDKMSKVRSRQQPKPNPKFKPNPNPNMTPKRLNELKRAKTLLRTIKCETEEGFYNLFECSKCQRQFNYHHNCIRHIQRVHMGLGNFCSNCTQLFFNKSSLDLHIPKCSKREQFKKIKVWLKNDNKNPVKVQLHPHEKHQQKQNQAPFPTNRNQNPKKKPDKRGQNKRGKQGKPFDPLKIKVGNPFENFNLKKTMSVKVVIERIKIQDGQK